MDLWLSKCVMKCAASLVVISASMESNRDLIPTSPEYDWSIYIYHISILKYVKTLLLMNITISANVRQKNMININQSYLFDNDVYELACGCRQNYRLNSP